MIRRASLSILPLAVLVGLTTATSSYAQTNVGSFYPRDDGVAFAFVASAQNDHVNVDVAGTTWELSDPGGVTVYSDCVLAGPGHATCVRREGDYLGQFRAGNDRVTIAGRMDGRIGLGAGNDVYVDGEGATSGSGGLGDDLIDGRSGDDVIAGGPGRDELHGGNGRDWLDGAKGRDVLFGGPGPDRLDAADNQRDGRIDCGPGDDRVQIDAGLDPRPRHCEVVRDS